MLLLKIWRYLWRFHPYPLIDANIYREIIKKNDVFYGTYLFDALPGTNRVLVTCYEHGHPLALPTVSFNEITDDEWLRRGGLPMQGFVIQRVRSPESSIMARGRLPGELDKFCISRSIMDPLDPPYRRI